MKTKTTDISFHNSKPKVFCSSKLLRKLRQIGVKIAHLEVSLCQVEELKLAIEDINAPQVGSLNRFDEEISWGVQYSRAECLKKGLPYFLDRDGPSRAENGLPFLLLRLADEL